MIIYLEIFYQLSPRCGALTGPGIYEQVVEARMFLLSTRTRNETKLPNRVILYDQYQAKLCEVPSHLNSRITSDAENSSYGLFHYFPASAWSLH